MCLVTEIYFILSLTLKIGQTFYYIHIGQCPETRSEKVLISVVKSGPAWLVNL